MKKIILIGDLLHDCYIYGSVDKISPEFPIPIFNQESQEIKLGGAGNVYNNLLSFQDQVNFYKQSTNIPVKTRYVCNKHVLFRSDDEKYIPYDIPNIELDNVGYAILSDYNKGVLHKSLEIIELLNKSNIKIIVDPKKHISNYRNCFLIKFNLSEYFKYTQKLLENIQTLHKEYNIPHIIVTQGKDGILYSTEQEIKHYNFEAEQVSDVTGAGDIFIASLGHYLNKGLDIWDSIIKSTRLATISVSKFGTYVLTNEDIKSVEQRLIFTNGCFDILHSAHVEYLKKSRELGDKLIVGLNSDASVKKLKGMDRPVNNQEDRMAVLKSLKWVDEVILFDEETPYELIKKLKPDIITKGGDYKENEVVGNDLAQVVILPYIENYSTTKVINDLSDRRQGIYWTESSVLPRRFRRTSF